MVVEAHNGGESLMKMARWEFMGVSLRYCNLWRIDPASDRAGYKRCFIPIAQDFAREQGLEGISDDRTQAKTLQAALFTKFHAQTVDAVERSHAGLCLRCYVSEPILNACRKIDYLFGNDQSFTYRDLLPFVLNDDGQMLIISNPDGKTHLTLDHTGTPHPSAYRCFSLQILHTFKPNSQSSMSLDNWAHLQTRQNPELKQFLSEFGFQELSDWALLNRARPKQLEQLSERDRHLIEIFHATYRYDRQQNNQGTKRCHDPTSTQLHAMGTALRARNIEIQPGELLAELRQVARQLRQYDLWRSRESLEHYDPETGDRSLRSDLPHHDASELDVEQQELLDFFHTQLHRALVNSIQQALRDRIKTLETSKGYAAFADQLIPGLRLYYSQGLPLKETASVLGMSNWAQARRILNLSELISTVRRLTIRQMLHQILQKAQDKGLTPLPPSPDYLESLMAQIESFADVEIFQKAFEEIQSGKHRVMSSVYAHQLCIYLEEHSKTALGVA
jgi:hypothetical protein